MRFRCERCGSEFEAEKIIICPKCGEQIKVGPIRVRGHPRPNPR